jgi:hypothetical protein
VNELSPVEYAVSHYMKRWRQLTWEAIDAEREGKPLTARILRRRAAMLDNAIEAEIVNRRVPA